MNGNGNGTLDNKTETVVETALDAESLKANSIELETGVENIVADKMTQDAVNGIAALKAAFGNSSSPKIAELREQLTKLERFVRATDPQNLQYSQFGGVSAQELVKEQREIVASLSDKMQRVDSLESLFKLTATAVRETLSADRVLIYQFQGDTPGNVVAESVLRGFTPTLRESLPVVIFGLDRFSDHEAEKVVLFDSVETAGLTPYQKQLWEKFQIQASLAMTIMVNDEPWGLLAVHQCNKSRLWQEIEVSLLYQLILELTVRLQPISLKEELQRQQEQQKVLSRVVDRIQRSKDLTNIFSNATAELRKFLNCDRAVIYRFNPDWSGEIVAESVASGWVSLMQMQDRDNTLKDELMDSDRCTAKDYKDFGNEANLDPDSYLKNTKGGMYGEGTRFRQVDDVYQEGFSSCYLATLEKFQCRAYINVPLFQSGRLWGLICIYQNNAPRQWLKTEVEALVQISAPLAIALQQAEVQEILTTKDREMERTREQERTISRIIDKIRQAQDIYSIFRTTTQELRQLLNCDRSVVYRFYPDWSGEIVAESVSSGWISLMQEQERDPSIKEELMSSDRCTVKQYGDPQDLDADTYLKNNQGGMYNQGVRYRKVDDIYAANFSPCYIDTLEKFQCRAYINIPIFHGTKLWGLLCVYQNSGTRTWTEEEVNVLLQISSPLSVALQQAETVMQLQQKTEEMAKAAERDRAVGKIIEKIRLAQDIYSIFRAATQEIRQLFDCDRSVVYRFYPDWSGEVVAESVAAGWNSLMQEQEKDKSIKADLMSSDRCTVKQYGDPQDLDADTYLKDTKGGKYGQGATYRQVDDIYAMGFSPCYIDTLEKFECRAYINIPIFCGNKLWGLFAVYQNSGARAWTKAEVEVLLQIANPLSVAIKQAETIMQIQEQTDKLARSAEREQAISRITSRLLQANDIEQIFKITTQELRNMLRVDRVAVYQFDSNWSGKFVAESAASGWSRVIDVIPVIEDSFLQDTKGGRYKERESLVVNDIYTIGHAPCHVELLEQMEARAYMISPIFNGTQLWGLLGAYQNTGARQWEEAEVNALAQVGIQAGAALKQVEYLKQVLKQSEQLTKIAERENSFITLIYKLGQRIIERLQQKTLDSEILFRAITQELRQLLKADRVAVYRFSADWSGEFFVEDVGSGFLRLAGMEVADPVLRETTGGRYRKNETSAVENINTATELTFTKEVLEQWGAKAYAIVPLFKGDRLWGLLTTFQNNDIRVWEDGEINLLVQVATQLGIVLQQSEYMEQLQVQSEQLSEAASREKADKEALQQEVAQLLSAVQPAMKGDLTVKAPVSDDEVGKIADTYNNTLESLRKLVLQVQQASQKVALTSQNSESSIVELSNQAQTQVQALSQALTQIQSMVDSTEAVAQNAHQVENAVQQANQTVKAGETAMNKTVDGIANIRETVAETSKRIKRLSESGQKVSRVVSLIGNFTTQTQILALNAAIEATKAGENGRGFAVVADEVRSLARQSGDATAEIEELVQEIQAGTFEVAAAMDTGIQQVVEGTQLVTEVRQQLNAIVEATTQISNLVERITNATQVQNKQSQSVTQTMTDVAAIANKTSTDANQLSASFKELLGMAQDLQNSASQFKADRRGGV
jgi:methyl-accepting chemotaxis protein PixJ